MFLVKAFDTDTTTAAYTFTYHHRAGPVSLSPFPLALVFDILILLFFSLARALTLGWITIFVRKE